MTSEFKVKDATIYKNKIGQSNDPDAISLAFGLRTGAHGGKGFIPAANSSIRNAVIFLPREF